MYEKQLIKAGLDEKQAKIYLACLELGKAKAPEIAKKAEIKRTTAYGILDELIRLGLVSSLSKGKLKFFQAQEPRSILEMLENNKKQVASIIPDLENIFSTKHLRPQIQFFEGREGIKRIYEDTLRCRFKNIYQIVKVKDFISFPDEKFAQEYIEKRVARGIMAYALHPSSGDIYNENYGRDDEKLKRQVRYLPADMFYAAMIMIYDNKVAMISTREENFGFIIESKEFSKTLKAYFDFMWNVGSKQL